jgi:hypothetical protein
MDLEAMKDPEETTMKEIRELSEEDPDDPECQALVKAEQEWEQRILRLGTCKHMKDQNAHNT